MKKREYVVVVDAQISVMMRRKILFWENLVLSGFTSDVRRVLKKAPKDAKCLSSISITLTDIL